MVDPSQAAAHATWYGNLHYLIAYPWIVFVLVLASALCGTIIGQERRSRRKPAGMRTVTLICMGSTLFTIVSMLLPGAGAGDPSRIAAQVVTGIGFLGAGTILHTRERVKGLTTAATIWVVAAIGLLIGAGYAVPAIVLSIFVVMLLSYHERAEERAGGGEPTAEPAAQRTSQPAGSPPDSLAGDS